MNKYADDVHDEILRNIASKARIAIYRLDEYITNECEQRTFGSVFYSVLTNSQSNSDVAVDSLAFVVCGMNK